MELVWLAQELTYIELQQVNIGPKCQKSHRTTNWPYDSIRFHNNEVISWITTHVNLVVAWTVLFKTNYITKLNGTISEINYLDSATYFPAIIYIKDKCNDNISRIFDDNFVCHYLSPIKLVYVNET